MTNSNIEAAIADQKSNLDAQREGHMNSAAEHQLAAEAAKKAAEGIKTPSDSVLRQTVTFDAATAAGDKADAAAQQARLAVATTKVGIRTSWLTAGLVIGAVVLIGCLAYGKINSDFNKFAKAQAGANATTADSFALLQETADANSADLQTVKGELAFLRKVILTLATKSDLSDLDAKMLDQFAKTGCTDVCTSAQVAVLQTETCGQRAVLGGMSPNALYQIGTHANGAPKCEWTTGYKPQVNSVSSSGRQNVDRQNVDRSGSAKNEDVVYFEKKKGKRDGFGIQQNYKYDSNWVNNTKKTRPTVGQCFDKLTQEGRKKIRKMFISIDIWVVDSAAKTWRWNCGLESIQMGGGHDGSAAPAGTSASGGRSNPTAKTNRSNASVSS